jgi:hypothetical protein
MWNDHQENIAKLNKAKNGDQLDEEMTEDEVDWHDFVIVEQIELYNDQEMEQ